VGKDRHPAARAAREVAHCSDAPIPVLHVVEERVELGSVAVFGGVAGMGRSLFGRTILPAALIKSLPPPLRRMASQRWIPGDKASRNCWLRAMLAMLTMVSPGEPQLTMRVCLRKRSSKRRL
jgi:hypothetical protein